MNLPKHEVWLVCGSRSTLSEIGTDAIQHFEFNTALEKEVFLQGVDAASGYVDVGVCETAEEAQEYLAEMVA